MFCWRVCQIDDSAVGVRIENFPRAEDHVPATDIAEQFCFAEQQHFVQRGLGRHSRRKWFGGRRTGPVAVHDVADRSARLEQVQAAMQKVMPEVHARPPPTPSQRRSGDEIEIGLRVEFSPVRRVPDDEIEAPFCRHLRKRLRPINGRREQNPGRIGLGRRHRPVRPEERVSANEVPLHDPPHFVVCRGGAVRAASDPVSDSLAQESDRGRIGIDTKQTLTHKFQPI